MPVGVGALPTLAFTARTPVRNQKSRNACTAFAFGGAIQIIVKALLGQVLITAALALYRAFRIASGFSVNADQGAYMEPCARALQAQGAGSEALWPYETAPYADEPPEVYRQEARDHRVISWYRALSVVAMKTALSLGLPVVMGFQVQPDFSQVGVNGEWQDNGGAAIGGHAVLAVGYDDAHVNNDGTLGAFLMQNSWGKTWGTNHPHDVPGAGNEGFFWVPYTAFPGRRWFDAIVIQTLDTAVAA